MISTSTIVDLVRTHVAPENLESVQPSVQLTLRVLEEKLRQRKEHIRAAIDRELDNIAAEYRLSKFSAAVFRQKAKQAILGGGDGSRLRAWIFQRINGGAHRSKKWRHLYSPWQLKCPILIPNLHTIGFWEGKLLHRHLPWVSKLEALFPKIKQEFLALRDVAQRGEIPTFQPYRAPTWTQTKETKDIRPSSGVGDDCDVGSKAHDRGNWNVFYLWLHNIDFEDNRELCPITTSALLCHVKTKLWRADVPDLLPTHLDCRLHRGHRWRSTLFARLLFCNGTWHTHHQVRCIGFCEH